MPGDLKETPPGETAVILGRAYDPEGDRFKDVGSVKIVYPEPGAITGEIHFRVNDGTAASDQLRMKLTRDGKPGIGRDIEPREMLHVEGGAIIGVPNGHSEWNNMVLAGERRFQKDSQVAGAGFVTTPWVYTRAIESDVRSSEATLISLGSHNGFTGNDQIGFVTYGELRAIVDAAVKATDTDIHPTDPAIKQFNMSG